MRLILLLMAVLATPSSAERMTLEQCEAGFGGFVVTIPGFHWIADRKQRLSDDDWCEFDAGENLWPVPARWRFHDEAASRIVSIEANLGPMLGVDPGCTVNLRGRFVQKEADTSLEISNLEFGWSQVDRIGIAGRVTGYPRTAFGKRFGPFATAEFSELSVTALGKHWFLRSLLEAMAVRNREDDVHEFRRSLLESLSGNPIHPSVLNAQSALLSALEDVQQRNGRLHLELRSDAGLNAAMFLGWLLYDEPLEPDQAQVLFATTRTQGRWEPVPEMADVVVTSPCGAPLSRSGE